MHIRQVWSTAFLAGFALVWYGGAQAASCTPQDLMAKVTLATQLLEHQMQLPAGPRRVTAARMRAFMQRHQSGVVEYQGVCDAYDDLIEQLRR